MWWGFRTEILKIERIFVVWDDKRCNNGFWLSLWVFNFGYWLGQNGTSEGTCYNYFSGCILYQLPYMLILRCFNLYQL